MSLSSLSYGRHIESNLHVILMCGHTHTHLSDFEDSILIGSYDVLAEAGFRIFLTADK
jgi:hypothetical protein